MYMKKTLTKAKVKRRKLHFEAVFAKNTEPDLWEDINDYLESIDYFEYNKNKVIT